MTKNILITGTSSGFGLLMAARLASQGHRVFATMRNLKKQDALLKEVQERGGKVKILPIDVTNNESITQVVDHIVTEYGSIDVLVNNAGQVMGGFFEDLSEEEIRNLMDVNFFGVQNVIRAVIPSMRKQKSGKIINISSVSGFYGSPGFGAYNASKWALEGFSESLWYELQPFGIDVSLIEPGTYKTEIFYANAQYAKGFNNPKSPYYNLSHHLNKKIMKRIKRSQRDPEEIAVLVEKLIKVQKPPLRNIPNKEAWFLFLFKKILPFCLFSRLIKLAIYKGFNDKTTAQENRLRQ